ncbi:MAG: ATP-binding protein [Bacteroidetes bacterium]|nr:ATP-binding protein [Bacteroidota bacterium]
MRHTTVVTDNVTRFRLAMGNAINRPQGTEGMVILWGRPGEGKSTVIVDVALRFNAMFLRATSAWTMTTMLQALCRELQLPTSSRRQQMMDAIIETLSDVKRPIIVDEADYLLRGRGDMIDALRDIYDMTGVPVVFVGMEEFKKRLRNLGGGRFMRRLTQWVEFSGLTLPDTRLVIDTLCEIAVDDDLVQHVHDRCEANIGRIVIAISRIEAAAKASSPALARIGLEDFGKKTPLWLDHVSPTVTRRAA